KPARPLSRAALESELVRLEPVDVARHAGQLFAAQSSAPELWEYLPYGPFESETDFRVWLTERAASSDPLFYAIVERRSGRALGSPGPALIRSNAASAGTRPRSGHSDRAGAGTRR